MSQTSKLKTIVALVLLLCLGLWVVSIYWGQEPEQFSVKQVALEQTAKVDGSVVTGSTVIATSIHMIETLLNKPGGFLSNDVTPPSLLMDNIPSWEKGVIVQLRDVVRATRDSFSRSQSQSTEDKDLAKAESRLNISETSWMFPSAEDEYRKSADSLSDYLKRLSDDNDSDGQFYARADNLNYWLALVEVRLGSLSQRLSASVGQKRMNTDLAGDASAKQSTKGEDEVSTKTPWLKIDNEFYEARGTTWALLHLLRAIEVDFADILANKNAAVSVAQIIRELEATQHALYSPIVLNGGGFGLWANHSLVMASYVSRANAAIIDLRELLQKG